MITDRLAFCELMNMINGMKYEPMYVDWESQIVIYKNHLEELVTCTARAAPQHLKETLEAATTILSIAADVEQMLASGETSTSDKQ